MSGRLQRTPTMDDGANGIPGGPVEPRTPRLKSEDLFRQQREVEIAHQGRIYRLSLTLMNKLILTA